MDSEQVTVWLQTQHQDRVSKMDKFFTDAFAQAGCILITCRGPDKLTLSVMQYVAPRRVM